MHTVIETAAYLAAARATGLSDAERESIVSIVSGEPTAGELIVGTGGARKLRFAGRGKGKSGGYRVITFFAAPDVPVFLLTIFGKGEKDNLAKAERNTLAATLKNIAAEYRTSVAPKGARR